MSKKKLDEAFQRAMSAAKQEQKRSRAENIRRYGGEKEARKVSPIYRDLPGQKVLRLAKVNGDWFSVHRKALVDPDSWKGEYYFFGIGSGFDILRIVVKADSLEEAMEHAENKLPKLFFTKVITTRQYDKLSGDDWETDPDNYHFIESLGKWGLPEEDIRIAKKVTEYVPTAAQAKPYTNTAILPDGRKVEYR